MKYPTAKGLLAVLSTALIRVRDWETVDELERLMQLTSNALFRSKRESFTLKIISLLALFLSRINSRWILIFLFQLVTIMKGAYNKICFVQRFSLRQRSRNSAPKIWARLVRLIIVKMTVNFSRTKHRHKKKFLYWRIRKYIDTFLLLPFISVLKSPKPRRKIQGSAIVKKNPYRFNVVCTWRLHTGIARD